MKLRVHRVPDSTNVERIALAAGIKGVAVEWADHADDDRSAVRELSGQDYVPVAEFDDDVVFDSIAILRRLEAEVPEPPLWPDGAADGSAIERAEAFISWFNDVWKLAPNALAAPDLDPEVIAAHAAALEGSLPLFESLLAETPFMAGARVGVEDVCAYPFLRYRRDEPGPDDADPFHAVLHRHLAPGASPQLDAWLGRIGQLPQA